MGIVRDSKASKIIRMYNEGYSKEEICDELGISSSLIYNTLTNHGIKVDRKIPSSLKYKNDFTMKWNIARYRILRLSKKKNK